MSPAPRNATCRRAQGDSEHVFQAAWNDIVTNGMTPEAATEKALKRTKDIFAKYPIAQS